MHKKLNTILQGILGLAFLVFGLNKFLGFLPAPGLPMEAGAFFTALAATGYMIKVVALVEIITGAMLLFRFYSALALVLLAPISVNIVLFHVFLAPAGGAPAYVLAGLNLYLLIVYLPKYKPMLVK